MKTVLLSGGMGTRLAEETAIRPKPMVEVGSRPLLWHIMSLYSHYGFKEFHVALGYLGNEIKRYFLDYYALSSNMTINLANGDVSVMDGDCEDWTVSLIDTGLAANTGGRIRALKQFLDSDTFMVTYGDGVANVNIKSLLDFHRSHGKLATVTAVRPPARFGGLLFDGNEVVEFTEKPQIGEGWINGGFLVFEPGVFDYLDSAKSSLETDALERLATDNQLMAYKHDGFWQCMDTLRDVNLLRQLWDSGNPPWKVWG